MKLIAIKDTKELIGGQYFIRAWLDFDGNIMLNVFRLRGRVYKAKAFSPSDSFCKVRKIKITTNEGYNNESFITDFGLDGSVFKILVPFSNKALRYLKTISAWDLASIQNGNHLTKEEFFKMMDRWEKLKAVRDLQLEIKHNLNNNDIFPNIEKPVLFSIGNINLDNQHLVSFGEENFNKIDYIPPISKETMPVNKSGFFKDS